VWWVFSRLYEQGLVYQGVKVMPFSTGCCTPLSNFEANLNYQEVSDPAVYVTFPLVDEPDTEFVAWTTTPWTLPSNLALCVNKDLDYVKIRDEALGRNLIVGKTRLEALYPPAKKSKKAKKAAAPEAPKYTILKELKGSDLVGIKYEPLFEFFREFADEHILSLTPPPPPPPYFFFFF
ncbi:hypothetical protein KIPB_013514, partial [Kipferlia bialata]